MTAPPSETQSPFARSMSSSHQEVEEMTIPHRGSLCRIEGEKEDSCAIAIQLDDGTTHQLLFSRGDFDFTLRLFTIMDSESRGHINKSVVKEFVTLRCPVFWRRDEDLKATGDQRMSPTFEEVWSAVATCGTDSSFHLREVAKVELGLEGWMVFCRFIALAQYLEAKRRFSGRHLQQTMRHRNSPRGSEVVVIDVPPAAPPLPLTAVQLAQYERESNSPLPLPELDLDHSLVAAHDVLLRRKEVASFRGFVKVDLFGMSPSRMATGSPQQHVEFCLTFYRHDGNGLVADPVSVRRSIKDLKWLHDTLTSHKALGGTLCGRILPPFPGKSLPPYFNQDDLALGGTSDAIAAAASAGVGMISKGIKSLWGKAKNTVTTTTSGQSSPKNSSKTKKKSFPPKLGFPESYYNPNSPTGVAQQLERYLNYLLEHPALSTSFALNTILKHLFESLPSYTNFLQASQSGVEAANQSLEEHTRAAVSIKEQAPKIDDGKLSNFWSLHGTQPNLTWVRTAAQAAVALQLHGVLETSGLPSASARLQHASLPKFNNARETRWNKDEGEFVEEAEAIEPSTGKEEFEEGVLRVKDGLVGDHGEEDGAGYDLLPLPVPAPERRFLTMSDSSTKNAGDDEKEARFLYGDSPMSQQMPQQFAGDTHVRPALLGDIAVDENIDKLREVIGSVDNTLSRCMASSGGVGKARRGQFGFHLDIVRGLDFWEGLRGKFVSQRALLKGVSGIEQSREVFEESDLSLINDVSWQTALANSAVSAAEDVRSTVRAAKTASSAKAAATSAAIAAQKSCDTGHFNSVDEARAAQTRASIAKSHAFHAAVVEHEALTAKRRATLALAHDVKCWNAHRKREVLRTALAFAKSQHEATRRAVDAWSCLQNGYVEPPIFPSAQQHAPPALPSPSTVTRQFSEDVETTIFSTDTEAETPTIVAVEHELLKPSSKQLVGETEQAFDEPEMILPLVVASPIQEEEEDVADYRTETTVANVDLDFPMLAQADVAISLGDSVGQDNTSADESPSPPFDMSSSRSILPAEEGHEGEVLSSSMKSLVDGLMNWGGQYDNSQDFTLPAGMAASIALEESTILGSQTT
eukprot:Nitzschia sp. Nitz4//scaffold121_size67750//53970//57328//NITZ4_006074-RA/size67750-snap-gene-0.43-mRNA-1//-1//CDS//3329534369//7797//frame0